MEGENQNYWYPDYIQALLQQLGNFCFFTDKMGIGQDEGYSGQVPAKGQAMFRHQVAFH